MPTFSFCLPFAVVATQEGETVKLSADAFCCAAGCQYNLNPSFLKEMGIGECGWRAVRLMTHSARLKFSMPKK